MVSALIPSKFVDIGIDAERLVPDGHLVVAGTGSLRQSLEARATKRALNYLHLLSVPPEKMSMVYRSADVFLHLSKEEAFGNVYLEAMACGLPVVGYTPRVRWIVGDDQYLAQGDQPAAIAKAILAASRASSTNTSTRVARAQSFCGPKSARCTTISCRKPFDKSFGSCLKATRLQWMAISQDFKPFTKGPRKSLTKICYLDNRACN